MKICCAINSKVTDSNLMYEEQTGKFFVRRNRRCLTCGEKQSTREYLVSRDYFYKGKYWSRLTEEEQKEVAEWKNLQKSR